MLNFSVPNKDTGLNNQVSIQPVNDGEDANQNTFRRPSENLRTRTEVIRKSLDHLVAEVQADRGLCVMSSPDAKLLLKNGKLRLNVAGTDTASDRDLVIAPIVSTYNFGTPPGSAIRAKYYYTDGETPQGEFQVVAKNTVYAYNGGNNLFIKIFKNGRTISPALPVVTVEGADGGGSYPADGPVILSVEVDKDNLHTIQNVVDALIASGSPALPYIDTGLTMVIANGTNVAKEVPISPFHASPGGMAAVDAECYRVTAAQIDNFFQPAGQNKTLTDGDVLVINFSSPEARRACRYDTSIASLLQIVAEDSRALANGSVVPICKMGNGRVYFLNGKSFEDNAADYLVLSASSSAADTLRTDLAATTGSPKGDHMIGAAAKTGGGVGWSVALGTVNSQLQAILTDLAANTSPGGASKIGAIGVAGSPYSLAAGSAAAQLSSLLSNLNAHVTSGGHPIGHIADKPFVTVNLTGEADYDNLSDALSDLADDGGVILVTGTFGPVTCASVITKPILVLGSGALFQDSSSGPTPALTISAAPQAPLVFKNVKFISNYTDTIVADAAPLNNAGLIVFEDCVFDRSSLNSTTTYVTRGRVPRCFHRCSFFGKDVAQTAHAHAVITDNPYVAIEMYECYFRYFKGILIATGAHSHSWTVVAERNLIHDCGYSPATGADPSVMFELDSVVSAWISNNTVKGSSGKSGRFATGDGRLIIKGNNIAYGCDEPGNVSTKLHMIDGTSGQNEICDNFINTGLIGGIRSCGVVRGNNILFSNEHSDMNAICVPAGTASARVTENLISCVTSTINSCAVLIGDSLTNHSHRVVFSGNQIGGNAASGFTAVSVRNPQGVSVCNNVITMTSEAYGIVGSLVVSASASGYGLVINNNVIDGFIYPIRVSAVSAIYDLVGTIISGNVVTVAYGPGVGVGISLYGESPGLVQTSIVGNAIRLTNNSVVGIDVDSATGGGCHTGVIGSNTIYGTASGDTGIRLDATSTHFAISGNAVIACTTPIVQGNNSNGIGSGTPRDITHNAY